MDPDQNLPAILAHLAKEKDLINDHTPSADIIDLDYIKARVQLLLEAFPEPFITNTLAMKANSIRGVLRHAFQCGIQGVECASISEVVHGLENGFPAHSVIYDSPCKTKVDLAEAIKMGVVLNLDNELEVDIVDRLLSTECKDFKPHSIGLRINPVVGKGSNPFLSTAGRLSKFGLPLVAETRDALVTIYRNHPWLTGIHFHVGSQGVPMDLFVTATRVIMDFVSHVEKECGRSLTTIDIGGGLSSAYTEIQEPIGFAFSIYRKELEAIAPQLFSGKYRVITEFGRSLLLKSGKTLTRVETVKQWLPDIHPLILTHVGANQFIREVYAPNMFSHRISVATKQGVLKEEDTRHIYDIGGPLCFQGDYIAKDVELPEVNIGDILVIHETGAYGMAQYSKYNSILPSPVYGYERDGSGWKVVCLKERETPKEALEFWGAREPRPL